MLKNKIKTLIIPYILFNTIAFAYKQVIRNLILNHEFPIFSIKKIFDYIILAEANPLLWFIRVLFEFVILYPIITYIIKHKKLAGGIIAAIILHLLIGVVEGYSTIQYWMPVYLLGAVCERFYETQF